MTSHRERISLQSSIMASTAESSENTILMQLLPGMANSTRLTKCVGNLRPDFQQICTDTAGELFHNGRQYPAGRCEQCVYRYKWWVRVSRCIQPCIGIGCRDGFWNTVSHMAYDGSNWLFTTHESGKHNNGDGVFTIWDVSNKAAPTEYANIDTQNWTKYPGYYEGQSNTTATTSISYYNNTVYLAKYSWALDAYDVTNKDSVTEIWSSYITSYDIAAVDTKILGNYLYVTSRYTGFSNYCQDKGGWLSMMFQVLFPLLWTPNVRKLDIRKMLRLTEPQP